MTPFSLPDCVAVDASFPAIRVSIFNVLLSTRKYSIPLLLPKKIAFLHPHSFPFFTSSLYLRTGADFSNRNIPPALVAGHALIAVVLNVDHRRTNGCPHLLERSNKIGIGLALDHVCTQATRIRRQVNGQDLHIRTC